MNPQGNRDDKALNEVKSYLEQTGRKTPESFLTRSKKTYEVLAKLVVSKVATPAKPNAQSFIRSAAAVPAQQQVSVEKPSPVGNIVLAVCGLIGVISVVAIAVVVQRYAQSESEFKSAMQAMQKKDSQLALQELNHAYQLGFHAPQLYLLRAAAYADTGDFKKAVADYSDGIAANPNNEDALAARAGCYLRLHDNEPAISDCSAVLKINPNNANVVALRAVALANSGKFDRALSDCDKFIATSKDQSAIDDLKATRALVLLKLNKPEEASKDLDAAIAHASTRLGLRLLHAQCMLRLGKTAEAVDDLTAELKLDPNNVQARQLRAASFLKLNKEKEALADYNMVIERSPSPELYITRAGIYSDLKEYEPAVDDYDHAMEMKPATADLKAKREAAWQLLKKYRPVVATIKENISGAARSASLPELQQGADALTAKGYSLYRQGKLDDAIDVLSAAVKANPAAPAPRRYLAYACMGEGNYTDASTQFQVLLGMNSMNEGDQMQYARALTALGRAEEAVELLKDVIANNPGNSWARMSLIKLYLDTGATTKAMRLSQDGLSSAASASEREAYSQLLRATMSGGAH